MNPFKDLLIVLRPLWFIGLFQVLVGIAVIFMPQGQDMILAILEDFVSGQFWSFLCFIVALYFWSVTSEFGSRFILYLSDTSSHLLSPERVRRRKKIQRIFTRYMIFLPLLFATTGFLKAFISNFKGQGSYILAFGVVMALLGLVTLSLYLIYIVDGTWRKRFYVLKFDPLTRREAINNLAKLTGILEKADPQKKIYKPLFKRFYSLLTISIGIIAIFCFAPLAFYPSVGALAIIAFAFGSWITVYYALELMDKAQPFLIKLPWKFVVAVWIALVSIINSDHKLTLHPQEKKTNQISLESHFKKWLDRHGVDTTKEFSPVFIVAEGGALRTGAFTSIMLGELADSIHRANKNAHHKNARNQLSEKIYSFSSVSGGTVGANYFRSLMYDDSLTNALKKSQDFFRKDFLSATTGKLVFGEIVNLLIPWPIQNFDRAYALEKDWEKSYEEVNHTNTFSHAFEKINSDTTPAIFIHSTEVETGRRSIYSNIEIDSQFINAVDIRKNMESSVPHSAAIGMSARFPLISPSAAVISNGCEVFHYVDGGYYENQGATTTYEVITRLKRKYSTLTPRVLVLSFGESTAPEGGYKAFDEIVSIVTGIYNTRSAHTGYSNKLLRSVVASNDFIQLDLSASVREVPLNWILSERAVNKLEQLCKEELKKRPRLLEWFSKDSK